jgi:hypothetical protein
MNSSCPLLRKETSKHYLKGYSKMLLWYTCLRILYGQIRVGVDIGTGIVNEENDTDSDAANKKRDSVRVRGVFN